MKIEEVNLLSLKTDEIKGLAFFEFKINRKMQNVKPMFKGIRENAWLNFIGVIYNTNKKLLFIHLFFYKIEINLN